ncbi:unnamed protein product [Gongylonema pulchrum]|uniref:EamA domain-containing protein n=1 Tax=Gongylonema pulchrum TaxID=637853 RepID=A0A3P6PMK7_9BILA|nr:unnamed protein product [Gongylonema pulchrum]
MISAVVMLAVAFCWAMSTQFTKTALVLKKSQFYAPYFLVWFNTNFMTLCYPAYLLMGAVSSRTSISDIHHATTPSNRSCAAFSEALLVYGKQPGKGGLVCAYFLRTSLFLFFWLVANYSYAQSLGHISASATSSIMSCNTAIVCVLGWFILHDQFIPFRLVSVAAAIGGVVVMSMDKEFAGSILGISLSILSALSAALYKVLFKKVVGSAKIGQVAMFMSGLGMMNLFFNSVPMVTFLCTHVETFMWSEVPWLPLLGAAILALCKCSVHFFLPKLAIKV